MPRNGSGVYSLPQPPFTAGSVISSSAVNSNFSDVASALTGSLPRDGQGGMTGQLKASDGSIIAPGYSFTNETNTGFTRPGTGQIGVVVSGVLIATIDSGGWEGPVKGGVPIGTLVDYAAAVAPAQWLLCFGQNVSRTTYAALFAVLSTTYGSGDGTTFGIPDLRGRFSFGKDDMGGAASGRLTTAFFGSDPTIMGNAGGAQSRVVQAANLPAYTPSGAVTGVVVNSTRTDLIGAQILSQAFNFGTGSSFIGALTGSTLSSGAVTSTGNGTFTGNAQGGASTAFSTVLPSIILTKIIYAGV